MGNKGIKEMKNLLEEINTWEASRDMDAEISETRTLYLKKDVLGLNDFVLTLRDAGNRCIEKKEYAKAIEYYEEAHKAITESRKESVFKFWSTAVPEAYPTLVSLYCIQKEIDTAVALLNEYFTYLSEIYDGPMPDQINVDYVAGGIASILKKLVEESCICGNELIPIFKTAERFINFSEYEEAEFTYYSCYAKVWEPIDPVECKRLKDMAESAKQRMNQ